MTIGAWISVGIGLAGFLITLITIAIKLSASFTKLDATMQSLGEKISDINCENRRQHDNLFGMVREHTDKLDEHGNRITALEERTPPRKRTA